jgi:3-methyladenine DNA glycosylase AlkC
MGTPLKDSFGPGIAHRLAHAVARAWPSFRPEAFLADALDGYDDLELMARARHLARALRRHLPPDYEHALAILMASIGPREAPDALSGMASFFYAPHVSFVAEFGLDHWEASMDAQHELTQRFSAEFSIRPFLDREPERTLARLREWTNDESEHVRRLVSEGTRPRLPWAPRLRRFQEDPSPVLGLLERLKDDPSLYVRRSVANNLNDIGKDHPDLLVETCRRWSPDAPPARAWVIRHALRSAVKRGDREALAILGFGGGVPPQVVSIAIEPPSPRIGENVRVTATIRNPGRERATYNVDLRVHFVKAGGRTSPKVFKLRRLALGPGGSASASKTVSLQQHTTRRHYPGEHRVELVIDGESHAGGEFLLRAGSATPGSRGRGAARASSRRRAGRIPDAPARAAT